MAAFLSDVRYAFRTLRGSPGFTVVALAALALGIGANTAIFTVVNGVMLAPLPYSQPDRIMRLGRKYQNGNGYSNSIPKFMTWRRNNDVFSDMALYDQGGLSMSLGSAEPPVQVKAEHVSRDYFRVFGSAPARGRSFTDAEDLPGGPRVAVLSDRLWRNRFSSDPRILGQSLVLSKQPYTVVGVMPPGFESDPQVDLWIPLQADPNSINQGHYLGAAARLKPGVDVSQARAAMKVAGERFRAANPKWMDKAESVAVVPMRDSMVEDARTGLLILLGAVAFVLLIACANVANLLLARAAVRQKELAIRAAVGASRWRVVRQLLTESVILAGMGGALGFAIGAWGVRMILLLAPGNIPRLTDQDGALRAIPLLDWRVALFSAGVAALTGILFGLFPALHTSNPDLASTLKEGGRSGAGHFHNRARSALVITEVALALVLLIGAGLLIRSFAGLRSVDPGFNPHNVLALETSMSGGAYANTAQVAAFVTEVTRRLEALPGVQAASSALALPISGTEVDLPFNIAGRTPAKGQYEGEEQYRTVSPHYFQALQIPLLRGRVFNDGDTGSSPRVVLINQAMAKKFWPKEDPAGKVIVIGAGLGPQFADPPREIVGVVGTVRETGLDQADEGVMYVPQTQVPEGLTALANNVIPLSWAVRAAADPMALRVAIEHEIRSVDGLIAVSHTRTMDQMVTESLARNNFMMMLLSVFAGLAMLLAAIGVYGLMSYSVERRTQEIGIRVALGAGRQDVLRLIVGDGLKLACVGVVAGLAIAYGVTRILGAMLFGVKAADPLTFTAVAMGVSGIAFLASYFPARRAAALDASDALRHE
ncbi:MAG TPA: ABC transporter permease [Bryobacteraceae bacterium]|nr:ABC transporter permease [Bryobacteraceae bacterium]